MTVNFLIASVFFHSYHDHQSFHSFPTRRSSDLFSPLEALQAATLNPAIYFHKRAEFGTVEVGKAADLVFLDRKSTRLNSSHGYTSYAVFCLKKKIMSSTSFYHRR